MKTFAFLRVSPLYDEYKKTGITSVSCGRYNGYVGIINGDSVPLSEIGGCEDYDNSLDNMVVVHGGITFDGKFGGAEEIIPLTEIPADWWKYRIVGFDCAHLGDTEENCPYEFVRDETTSLQKQIEQLIKQHDYGNSIKGLCSIAL